MTGQDVKELCVAADLREIDRVRSFLRDFLPGLGFKEEDELKVELALHEICVNVVLYAYPEGCPGEMAVRLWRADGSLFVEVRDRGVPFDPAKKPHPDLLSKIRHGKRGGFGIYLFKTLMDGFAYRREGNENIMTVFKRSHQ